MPQHVPAISSLFVEYSICRVPYCRHISKALRHDTCYIRITLSLPAIKHQPHMPLISSLPSPLLENIELWWFSGGQEGILSELLCAELCDTMFTVSSTLMWAVLTGPTNWVCHSGTLTPHVEVVAYSCIIVTWQSGSGGIQAWSWRSTGFLQCFDTVGLVIWPVKIVPEMTYNVLSGTLSLYNTTTTTYIGPEWVSYLQPQRYKSDSDHAPA